MAASCFISIADAAFRRSKDACSAEFSSCACSTDDMKTGASVYCRNKVTFASKHPED